MKFITYNFLLWKSSTVMRACHLYMHRVFLIRKAIIVINVKLLIAVERKRKKISLPSARQHPSYGDCLEVEGEYCLSCSVLGCVTKCSQSAAHLYEQFLQVQQIGFVTLGPLRHA